MASTRRLLKSVPVILLICSFAVFSPRTSVARLHGADEAGDFFESRIRPLLIANCYDCHADAAKGSLRVDSREALLKGGTRGPAIVPAKPEESLLLKSVDHTHETLRMPKGGAKLKAAEIADLTRWIKNGAVWPAAAAKAKADYLIKPEHKTFWSFQPIGNPASPATKGNAGKAIDAFLLAKLEAKGLAFNPPADKRTLIRRASYDLTGLPPTPAEVNAFIADNSPDSFAKVIDRLLASPHYGERWARHWLDLARYSDTVGMIDAGRNLQEWYPYSYTYRDWVIRALNEDLPYDQFIQQQLAADRLPNNDPRNLAALGFLSLSRGGLGINQQEKIDDKIDVVSRGLLGLTVSCARCHNHKFDPIPTADYYSLYTIFNNSREPKKLPLLDAKSADGTWEDELKAEEKKIEAEVQKLRESRYPKLKELYSTEPEIAKCLRGVHEARAIGKDDELQKFARDKDYNLYMLKRWQAFLLKAGDDPVWTLWHKLAAIPESEFSAKAASALAAVFAEKDASKTHPLVAQAFQQAPATIREAAERYGKLIAAHDKPEPSKDLNEESLRQILRGKDSPVDFPFSDYEMVRLSTDKQNEDGKRRPLESLSLAQAYRGAPPRAQSLEDLSEPKPGHVFLRGKPENKGDPVHPQFLLILAGENRKQFTEGSGRLELARAIADKANPLTARVMVNRVWLRHFGAGLVRTSSDFGTRGDAPTHPELLDYLARSFIENGWSLKKLHRMMLLSRAYQQSSAENSVARQIDPENKLLWRINRRRLDFEELRDSLLSASGALDRAQGGLPVSAIAWPFTHRRTIYSFIDRALVPNDFRVFDFPNPEIHSAERYLTTVPQQAMMMMNSPFVIEQARALIARAEIAAEKNPRRKVRELYRLVYGRQPAAEEIALALRYVNDPANTTNVTDDSKCAAWQYGQGEYDETAGRVKSFNPFAYFLNGEWRNTGMPGDPRTSTAVLTGKGGLTYEGKSNALIRRWIAPFDGRIAIRGRLEQNFENGCRKCEGVTVYAVSGRSGNAGKWTAIADKSDTAVNEIAVSRGDTIDFIADAGKGSAGNGFKWEVTIRQIDSGSEEWNSARDFRHPTASALNAWGRYAQVLLAAAEFVMID